jgi:cytoskeletal protein CcmA (bactofilin family)
VALPSSPRGRLRERPSAWYVTAMDTALPATEITALLGRGTNFEGKLHFEGRVRIDGTFKGEIQSDDTLIVGDGAEVHAEIDVATIIVRGGVVHGNIRAKNAIEIHAPGKLHGNIHSPSVFIDRGVEFQGSCRMDPLDSKTPMKTSPVAATPGRAGHPSA